MPDDGSASDVATLLSELATDGIVLHPKNTDMLYWVNGRREEAQQRSNRLRTFLDSYRREGGNIFQDYELRTLNKVSGYGSLADMPAEEWRSVSGDLIRLAARMRDVASRAQK